MILLLEAHTQPTRSTSQVANEEELKEHLEA